MGSDSQIEETLQKATDTVVEHVTDAGLEYSQSKSELLVLRPPDRRKIETPLPSISVYVHNTPIPQVDSMKVLGLNVQNNHHNNITMDRLAVTVNQTAHLISRASRAEMAVGVLRTMPRGWVRLISNMCRKDGVGEQAPSRNTQVMAAADEGRQLQGARHRSSGPCTSKSVVRGVGDDRNVKYALEHRK
ncbi:hypothetical protein HPB50_028993 [Hyalomma asiaticum]|nr:hypothetical protein HPB50_028993 [Hyalomma asiaticum]